jgi:Domain of unknown function (DUF4326)
MPSKPISPARIQLSRKAGFNLQNESSKLNGLPCVKVSRPTKWGNPYKIGETLYHAGTMFQVNAKKACELYAVWVGNQIESGRLDVRELRGKNLACFCPLNQQCHGDVLLRLANVGAEASATRDNRTPKTL